MATATATRPKAPRASEATLEDVRAWPSRFGIVPTDALFVDTAYQRPLTSFVEKIQDEWDPAMVNCLVVNKRKPTDERYAVIDGQTRQVAGKAIGVPEFPCLIFDGLTRAQEARLFARLQKERRNMTSFQRFRAQLAAGEPEAKAIQQIATEAGYELGHEPGKIKAVASLEHLYRREPALLERTMIVLREAWKDRIVPDSSIIRGLGRFLYDNDDVDDEKLARRLSTITLEALNRRASALREGTGHGGGSDKYMAQAIQAEYQRRGRS